MFAVLQQTDREQYSAYGSLALVSIALREETRTGPFTYERVRSVTTSLSHV